MKKTVTFLLLLIYQISFSQAFDVETIFRSGSNESRINFVILSDGYQAAELNKFIRDATNFSDTLFNQSPFKEYKNYFNIQAIKVPSEESGATHPGNATDVKEPFHPVSTVNNYFESAFDSYGIHRLLVSNNSRVTTVLANNFPNYDIVLILVNTPYYGGSGGSFAVSSLHSSATEIVIHELGHSFTKLADEYYAGDQYSSEHINMTQETNPKDVKWKNWIDTNKIAIYKHCCGGKSENWYRPHQNCKMRYLGQPFCSVCIEATIEKIHSLTSAVDSFSPSNTGVVSFSDPMTFLVDLIEIIPNTLGIQWKLNGSVIHENVNSVVISSDDLSVGTNKLQATIKDISSFLKVENHETIHFETILWSINKTNLSIDEISENSFNIELFPNPTQEILYFNLTNKLEENYAVSINDISGKQMIYKNISYLDPKPQISLSELPAGIYVVHFSMENGLTVSSKIIKK
jgi:hypothetical protein